MPDVDIETRLFWFGLLRWHSIDYEHRSNGDTISVPDQTADEYLSGSHRDTYCLAEHDAVDPTYIHSFVCTLSYSDG